MLTREDIFKHVKEKYGTSPDYPWKKYPHYAALRHEPNKKWYGLIMNVLPEKLGFDRSDEIDILNLKCPPEISDSLKNGENILPGYHMDKEHWISLVLERTDPGGEIYYLIEQSFNLTKSS
ncbi:MmcQ/YjbR family DNA-binding protein [Bacillus inaquosorum]|uniref:MmcQ/YjbR family DNA-binding protein n=1 Tax=Bacillus inaquosorum TaxID=483913 RepID=UPI002E20B568|nr:MmcQ/YjbR family DNA-binding protein [Bacillus inaquosorum]